jgi:DNA-binding NarL/FixJ family response regulator
VRVVIAEDSVLMREGVAKLLEAEGFELVGRAGNADELLLRVRSYKPDVAIVDVRMPPTHTDEGARAAVTIREQHPDVGVLLLSQVVEATFAMRLFSETPAGFGYLLKDRVLDVDDFVDAIRRVARGGTAVDPVVVAEHRRVLAVLAFLRP